MEKEKEIEVKVETIVEDKKSLTAPIDSTEIVTIPISGNGAVLSSAIVQAESWEDRLRIADEMIEGGLVPSSFNGEPGTVISAVEMGLELGLGPWAALNNMVVIEGKVTLTLNGMLALARSKGVLVNITDDYKAIKDKSGKVINRVTTVKITRGEDIYSPKGILLDSRVNEYIFSKYLSEARTAGLTDKANWKKMPR